jgi:hypothetical protein
MEEPGMPLVDCPASATGVGFRMLHLARDGFLIVCDAGLICRFSSVKPQLSYQVSP